MKIANPSAVIIEKELAGLSVCQRIDKLAGVCYQRNPKPTEEDAEQFCRKLIESGHFPALEMAVVHLWMPWEIADRYSIQKFIMVDPVNGDESTRSFSHIRGVSGRYGREGCVTGSIRAFMEADGMTGRWARNTFLFQQYPLFFKDNTKTQVEDRVYSRFATPEEIPWQHKHVAVRVICSRAISHQLVRHRPCSFLQESARFCKYDDGVTFIRPEWAEDGLQADYFETQCYSSEAMYKSRRNAGLAPQQARGALIHDVKTELIIYANLPEWLHIFKMRCGAGADPEARRIMVPLREQFQAEYPEMWEGEKE